MSTFERFRASRAVAVVAVAFSMTGLAGCGALKALKDVPEYLDSEFENVGPRDFITRIDLARVKLGMSPIEVKNRIGAPMMSDTNDQSRWDYVVKTGQGAEEEYVPYGVYFKDDKVVRVAALEKPPASTVAAAPAPAAAAPAAAPEAPAAAPVDAGLGEAGAIADMLSNWAAAWSAKDVTGYLGFYGSNFKPEKKSRSAWEAERRARLSAPETISVTLTDIQVTMKSDTEAEVKFKQEYTSNRYKDAGSKTLLLSKDGGAWKIKRELFSK